ncbi:MAG TPA: DUF433 domain-containing protein [Firmicutes bacterium]|nr:DUF433 domain-containing protein [Bacillota bacterium]
MSYGRITVDPAKMGGAPCIRGLRIPVATVVDLVANGLTREEIIRYYPDLEPEDIEEALRFAAEAVRRLQADTSEEKGAEAFARAAGSWAGVDTDGLLPDVYASRRGEREELASEREWEHVYDLH